VILNIYILLILIVIVGDYRRKMENKKTHEKWLNARVPINSKHHITEKGVEIFSFARNFKIVKK
jgi:hypothetical protein